MSMQLINEDEYTPAVYYGKGTYALTKEKIGTRYVVVATRTLVNPDDPADLNEAHAFRTLSRSLRRVPAASRLQSGTPPVRRGFVTSACSR
jgi:hypothetical protein